jgi:integrase
MAGRHGDGDGLQLVVSESGRRKWVLRYQMSGVRRDMGLGSYPSVGLCDARLAAADARKLIARSVDPLDARRTSRKAERPVPTFGDIAKIVIADAQIKSTNAKVRYQWERHLGQAYSGQLLARPVHEITTMDVAALLRPIWRTKPEVARKVYPAIRRVFEHARIRLRDEHGIAMPDNPARWEDLKAMGFETPAKLSRGNHPSLPYLHMPALPLVSLKDRAHRKEGFRVPLVSRAADIIRLMREMQNSPFVFPGQARGKPLSNMALLTLLKRMNSGDYNKWIDPVSGRPITAHGFRATFRTWAEEVATCPHAVIEQAMGHQVGTQVERAYRRTDVLEKRRELMDAWARHCSGSKAGSVGIEPSQLQPESRGR